MERNDFLTLYNNIIRNNSVDMKTALETIREYCIIKGKEEEKINIKATTEEHLGFTGEMQGISAHAVCLIEERIIEQ